MNEFSATTAGIAAFGATAAELAAHADAAATRTAAAGGLGPVLGLVGGEFAAACTAAQEAHAGHLRQLAAAWSAAADVASETAAAYDATDSETAAAFAPTGGQPGGARP